jgi:hypothetical protein
MSKVLDLCGDVSIDVVIQSIRAEIALLNLRVLGTSVLRLSTEL